MYGMNSNFHSAPCCGAQLRGIGHVCNCGHTWTQERYSNYGLATNIFAMEAEVEVMQDLERGDIGAAMFDQAAANDFAQGDFVGGMIDEALDDLF